MSQPQQTVWPDWPLFSDRSIGDLASGRFDAARLLWTDTQIFRAPQRNSLKVLEDIQPALEQARPLHGGEQEFLDISARITSADQRAFAEVWSDPRAYHWTRRAHELVGACCSGTELAPATLAYCQALSEVDPRKALALHLDQFKLFALGIALCSGTGWTLSTPMSAALPLAIPGTRWSLAGSGIAEITGVASGRVKTTAPVDWLECPVARHEGYSLPIHPHAFNVPGLEIVEPPLRAGLEYHRRHAPLIEKSLGHIARYAPDLFAHFRQAIRVAALKPRTWGSYDDFSHPELPGSFIASVIDNPLEMADHLIHEFQHNRLSFIEECGPLFTSAATAVSCYSPWRDKPRALYGVFHGVYVFVAVCRYWLQVYLANDVPPQDRNYAIDRLTRLPLQLALATGVLRRFAQLTPLGQTIFEQLARDVAELRAQVAAARLPADIAALRVTEGGAYAAELTPNDGRPLTAREAVLDHLRRYDIRHQCDGLEVDLPDGQAARGGGR